MRVPRARGFGDLHVAAMLLNDAVDHGKPQPGALARRLGGDKGLEDLVEHELAIPLPWSTISTSTDLASSCTR